MLLCFLLLLWMLLWNCLCFAQDSVLHRSGNSGIWSLFLAAIKLTYLVDISFLEKSLLNLFGIINICWTKDWISVQTVRDDCVRWVTSSDWPATACAVIAMGKKSSTPDLVEHHHSYFPLLFLSFFFLSCLFWLHKSGVLQESHLARSSRHWLVLIIKWEC